MKKGDVLIVRELARLARDRRNLKGTWQHSSVSSSSHSSTEDRGATLTALLARNRGKRKIKIESAKKFIKRQRLSEVLESIGSKSSEASEETSEEHD
jgi:hypothetical protein